MNKYRVETYQEGKAHPLACCHLIVSQGCKGFCKMGDMHPHTDGSCKLCWTVQVTMMSVSAHITYLGFHGGSMLHKGVFYETVNEIRQLRIFQSYGRNLEHHQIFLHESLVWGETSQHLHFWLFSNVPICCQGCLKGNQSNSGRGGRSACDPS